MSNDKLEVPRELLERWAYDLRYVPGINKELRALLAKPQIERKPFGWWRVPKRYPLQGAFFSYVEGESERDVQNSINHEFGFNVKWLYDEPVAQHQGEPVAFNPCNWTDRQVLDFLGVALRNVDLVGEVRLSEIRQGFECMRDRHPTEHLRDATKMVEQPAPVAEDAAKAFAKGFNTLEQAGGKYRINMQFANRDDAWAAYGALGKLSNTLNTK